MTKGNKKQRKALDGVVALRDSEIDFSDAAEVRDWSGAVVGKFYRPTNTHVNEKSRPPRGGGKICCNDE